MASATTTSRTPGGWRCSEHSDRPVELFCRRCARCVCALCPVLGAHRGHPVTLARDEAARVQKLIQECLEHLATKKQQHMGSITQIEGAAEKLKAHAESSKAWLKEKFTGLRLLLDEEEVLAKKFVDKNMQLALQAYGEQVESCKKQADIMNDLSSRVWSIGQEPNPIQLLQAYTATKLEIQRHMSLGELSHPVPLSFEPVKSFFKDFTEAMQSTLQIPLDVRLKENLKCQLSSSSSTKPGTLLKTSPSPERSLLLKWWMQRQRKAVG
uniref:Tripartite motif containing 14 n=1 Tax=Chinchilla lanigera TaxID=34839 RepID=A0A8C2VLC1_CHILA